MFHRFGLLDSDDPHTLNAHTISVRRLVTFVVLTCITYVPDAPIGVPVVRVRGWTRARRVGEGYAWLMGWEGWHEGLEQNLCTLNGEGWAFGAWRSVLYRGWASGFGSSDN
jgi:hypothetical protein